MTDPTPTLSLAERLRRRDAHAMLPAAAELTRLEGEVATLKDPKHPVEIGAVGERIFGPVKCQCECSMCEGDHHWMADGGDEPDEPDALLKARFGVWFGCKHCEAWTPDDVEALSEESELEAIVAKLPVDIEGNIKMPGDVVFHPEWDMPTSIDIMSVDVAVDAYSWFGKQIPEDCKWVGVALYYEYDTGASEDFCKPVSECYSTPEAAAHAAQIEK